MQAPEEHMPVWYIPSLVGIAGIHQHIQGPECASGEPAEDGPQGAEEAGHYISWRPLQHPKRYAKLHAQLLPELLEVL